MDRSEEVREIMLGRMLFTAATLACLATQLAAQDYSAPHAPTAANAPRSIAAAKPEKSSPYRPTQLTTRAKDHFELLWGVDALQVKAVEFGTDDSI